MMTTQGLSNVRQQQQKSDFGVIYLAFGKPFLAMALASFKSLRSTNPSICACLVTNLEIDLQKIPGWNSGSDTYVHIDAPDGENRLYKTAINEFSPFDKTLYLDCDTIICGDLAPLEIYLDYFDIGLRPGKSPGPKLDRDKLLFDGNAKFGDLIHWNGGVIAFRKNELTKGFFKRWNDTYRRLGYKRDQPALVEAVFVSECKLFPLEPRWNYNDNLSGDGLLEKKEVRDSTVVWHYKWDIDKKMKNDILSAAQLIIGDDVGDVEHCIDDRAPTISLRHPRHLLKLLVRAARGRLKL